MNDTADTLNSQLETVLAMFEASNLLMLVAGFVVLWLINWMIRRTATGLMDHLPTRRFTILQMTTLVSFVLYIGGTAFLLITVLNPPQEMLLAVGGSAAVAVGFALKDVAASLIAGIMLLFDRPFQVGDRVNFEGVYGEITAITLRSVRLQTLDDNTVTIPNARFVTDVVSSGNMGAMSMMVVTDFHLALDADIEQARSIVREVIVTSRFAYLKQPVTFAIEEIVLTNRVVIRLRAKAYVLDVNYEKAFQSDVTTRGSMLLREAGIARPPSA